MVKNPPANGRDARKTVSIPRSGRSPGVGNDNSFQYSYLEDSMDRGTWRAAVHGVRKSWTRLRMQALKTKEERFQVCGLSFLAHCPSQC